MSTVTRRAVLAWAVAGLTLLVALLIGNGDLSLRQRKPSPLHAEMQDWDVADLAEHLRGAGLPLRVVPLVGAGDPGERAYLTTTASTAHDLDLLVKSRDRLRDWKGTVYCERPVSEENRRLRLRHWADCCVEVGPFVLFGDTELLTRIATALDSAPQ
jgi:hypothetical protein